MAAYLANLSKLSPMLAANLPQNGTCAMRVDRCRQPRRPTAGVLRRNRLQSRNYINLAHRGHMRASCIGARCVCVDKKSHSKFNRGFKVHSVWSNTQRRFHRLMRRCMCVCVHIVYVFRVLSTSVCSFSDWKKCARDLSVNNPSRYLQNEPLKCRHW